MSLITVIRYIEKNNRERISNGGQVFRSDYERSSIVPWREPYLKLSIIMKHIEKIKLSVKMVQHNVKFPRGNQGFENI